MVAVSRTATSAHHLCVTRFILSWGRGWQDQKRGQTLVAPQFSLLVICWFLLETSHYFKRIKQRKLYTRSA